MSRNLLMMASVIALTAAGDPASAFTRDLKSMRGDEITALQNRLIDAGCYRGAIDGRYSKALEDAVKVCPDQEPVLKIETGMHTGVIRRAAGDAACRLAATGSDDKTVRIWSMADGRLQRTIRMPIGDGSNGKVYAVSMSPDGRYVAAGGWDAAWQKTDTHYLYVYDLAADTVKRIGPFENTLKSVAFSPNGRSIAIVLGSNNGLRVVDRDTGKILKTDTDYAADSYGVSWAPDGSLFTSSFDGFARRYGPDLRRTHKLALPKGKAPFAVQVDPQGMRVIYGYNDSSFATIFDTQTMKPLANSDTKDLNGTMSAAGWTANGTAYSAGSSWRAYNGADKYYLRPISADGRKAGADIPVSDDGIMDLQPCGNGLLYAAADPVFGYMENGKTREIAVKRTPDLRDKIGDAFTVSPDGRLVRFGLKDAGVDPVLFDLSAATLNPAPQASAGMLQPNVNGLQLTDWQNNYYPKLNGKTIPLDTTETSRAVAVRPDRTGFALAAEYKIRGFDSAGKERWAKDGPGVAWGVNFAQSGNLLLGAFGDGTIRWFRWSDGAELLALFIDVPTKRWVAWTPTGYYMASPGGEDLIGWHVNRGWDQTPDFFSAARFRDKFSRPDVVQRVLDTLDENQAVEAANAASRKKQEDVKPIIAQLPPVITIAGPKGGETFNAGEITIDYQLRTPSGQPVDKVDVLIDGRPATENRGLGRLDGAKAQAGDVKSVTVQVPQKDVEITLIARSGQMVSEPATVRLAYAGKAAIPAAKDTPDLLKPKLYALVIGVADYVDPNLKLGLSAKDAKDFAAALQSQQGSLYGTVEVKLLTDRDATRDSILDGLEWLEKQVTSRDVGVVFLAGHGVNDEKQTFWFLPSDATPEKLRQKAVSHDDIRRTMQALAGKAILFLDACHAGRAASVMVATRGVTDINAVINEFSSAENGVVTFASSTGREVSQESPAWGNGAFTKALIEGIGQGKADLLGKGTITLSQLDAFVVNRVKELTNGSQHAVMTRPATIGDYPIAITGK